MWYIYTIRHNIMTTCLIFLGSPCAAKTALTLQDMDLRPLRKSCGAWHWGVL